MTTAAEPRVRPRAHKTKDLRLTVLIRAKPEKVYHALTSARELCRWWLAGAETDARNMGRLRLVWPKLKTKEGGSFPPHAAVGESEGVFVDLEKGRKVAWVWKLPPSRRGIPALSSLFLNPRGRATEVILLHAGFAASPSGEKTRLGCAAGWEDCLAKLKLYLETGRTCKTQCLSLPGKKP